MEWENRRTRKILLEDIKEDAELDGEWKNLMGQVKILVISFKKNLSGVFYGKSNVGSYIQLAISFIINYISTSLFQILSFRSYC